MKIFVSSIISGFGPFRDAARAAATTLRHEAVMAEDFGAQPNSPQVACLQGVRSADLVILVLGENYGTVQGTSGVSPTHEEFLEARNTKPVLVFVQEGVTRDAKQTKFVSEVQGWQQGYIRVGFKSANELKEMVTRAIHDYELAHAVAPLDIAALTLSAIDLLPKLRGGNSVQSPTLILAVAGWPVQRIRRPAELEQRKLVSDLHQHALFAEPLLFDSAKGSRVPEVGPPPGRARARDRVGSRSCHRGCAGTSVSVQSSGFAFIWRGMGGSMPSRITRRTSMTTTGPLSSSCWGRADRAGANRVERLGAGCMKDPEHRR